MNGPGPRVRRQSRILITGAGGFLGSHLCERLLAEGYRVWGLDNFDPDSGGRDRRSNLDAARTNPDLHLVEGDVRDSVLLDGLLTDVSFDCIVHMAARPGEVLSAADPRGCFDVNFNGTLTLLEAMRRHHAMRAILASTCQVSRDDLETIALEGHGEDYPLSPYLASKRAAELVGHVYARRYGLSVFCLRIRSVYGPRQRQDQRLTRLADRVLAEEQIMLSRNEGIALTFVDDLIDSLVVAIESIQKKGRGGCFEIYDLGNAEPVSMRDLVRSLARHLGTRARVRLRPKAADAPADVPYLDASAARQLGFVARTDLDTGLRRFAEWYGAGADRTVEQVVEEV